MRKFKELKETVNPRVQRMIARSFILGCPICGPNSGCNKKSKGYENNWKSFRQNQWRVKDEN